MGNVSAVPALIDALVSTLTAALPAVNVVDGPGGTDLAADDWLFVGLDDSETESGSAAASSSQEWASLGARSRYEEIAVQMLAESSRGGDSQKEARDAAFATLASVEGVLVADPSLGDLARFGGIPKDIRLLQYSDDRGRAARLYFQLTFTARLSG